MCLGPLNPMDTKDYPLNMNFHLHLMPKSSVCEALSLCNPYLGQGEAFCPGKTVTNSTSSSAN
jgi:hypothetical protein